MASRARVMFVLFLPCLSRYDVHDDDDHDDNGVTLRRSPGVMRRIHTAATWRESTASLNKTDNPESASGKNPHGSEVERIHNSGNNPPALQSLAWTLLHGVPPAIVHGVLIFGIVQFADSQAEERRAREP